MKKDKTWMFTGPYVSLLRGNRKMRANKNSQVIVTSLVYISRRIQGNALIIKFYYSDVIF